MGAFELFMEIIIFLGSIAVANSVYLRCYKGSLDNYTEFPLDDANSFLNSSFYQPEQKLIIYTFGFNGTSKGPSVQRTVGVYLGTANIICLLNWEDEAAAGILGFLAYPRAVANAIQIGTQFGGTLVKLFNAGLSPSNVHLVGFSLGAHLYGYTGREVIDNGFIIDRITGLDPAGPGYGGPLSLKGLSASDASFVDVLHANPGGYAINENVGTVDIWANCESKVQPGCEETGLSMLMQQDRCSHDRSWEYFSEAIERPAAFEARSASGCDAWRAGEGSNKTVYLGDKIDRGASGTFYMRTNSTPLYGLEEAGSYPA